MIESIKDVYIPVAIGLLVLPIVLPLFIILALPIVLIGWLLRRAEGYQDTALVEWHGHHVVYKERWRDN